MGVHEPKRRATDEVLHDRRDDHAEDDRDDDCARGGNHAQEGPQRRAEEHDEELVDKRAIKATGWFFELGALRTDDAGGLTRRRARRDHVVHLEKHTHQGVVTHGESMGV